MGDFLHAVRLVGCHSLDSRYPAVTSCNTLERATKQELAALGVAH